VAARSNAWVCSRSLAGIACSIPTEGRLSASWGCCVLSGRGLCDGLIRGPTECSVSVIMTPQYWGSPGPLGAVVQWKKTQPCVHYCHHKIRCFNIRFNMSSHISLFLCISASVLYGLVRERKCVPVFRHHTVKVYG